MLPPPISPQGVRQRWRLLLIALALLLFTPGFVCASRVDRMEAETEALKSQFVEIQQRINNDQTQLTDMILRADQKVKEIVELQRKLDDLVKNNTVDLSLEIEQLRSEVQELRGGQQNAQTQIERNRQVLDSIAQAMNFNTSGQVVKIPTDKDGHYRFAEDKLATGQFADAEVAFQKFVDQYPTDPRAEEAWLRRGEALFELKQYGDVRRVLQELLKKNPSTKHADQAVYLIGKSSIELKDCKLVKDLVDYLQKRNSSYAPKLKQQQQSQCKP